jgi:hypothetical protein
MNHSTTDTESSNAGEETVDKQDEPGTVPGNTIEKDEGGSTQKEFSGNRVNEHYVAASTKKLQALNLGLGSGSKNEEAARTIVSNVDNGMEGGSTQDLEPPYEDPTPKTPALGSARSPIMERPLNRQHFRPRSLGCQTYQLHRSLEMNGLSPRYNQ